MSHRQLVTQSAALRLPGRACIHSAIAVDEEKLTAAGVAVHRVVPDGAIIQALAVALQFPAWFGGTADGLADCLGDLSWLPRQGRVLVIADAARRLREDPRGMGLVLSCWLDASARWCEDGLPFHLVLEVTRP